MADFDTLEVTSAQQWREWLSEHADAARGIWLVTFKQSSGRPRVTYDQIVEEALAFGWIDSQPRSLDENRSQLLVTPRNPKSNWSRRNKDRVKQLAAEGRMAPQGLAAVEDAKSRGTWTALDAVEELHEPDDLAAALDANAEARRYWDAFPRSTKRAILEWINAAKQPSTRARRIEEAATKAADDIRANQWRQPRRTQEPAPKS